MAAEQNLSEPLKALPAERQRAVLSVMRRSLGNVREELTRWDTRKIRGEGEPLEDFVERLLTEAGVIRREIEALLEFIAALDPEMAAGPDDTDSIRDNAASGAAEEPATLFEHRGSIAVSGEQDFSAIRQYVIDHHVREEER